MKHADRLSFLLTWIFVATTAAAAGYESEFPATRAGDLAKAYLEAFNSGDVATMQTFAADFRTPGALAKRPAAERGKRTFGLYGQMGVLEQATVTGETENSITITVHSTNMDMWLSCKFDIAEGKLDGVTIMPTSAPEDRVAQSDEFDWETTQWTSLNELLTQVRRHADVPAIAAAVVHGGEVTDTAVVGVRVAGSEMACEQDDAFHIGSIGKSMTATMIGRLIEKGVLSWDTKVSDVVTDITMHDQYRDVTLEELLHHRSGLPGFGRFNDEDDARLNGFEGTTTEKRAFFLSEALESEPVGPVGAMEYSNAGYVLAAYMAETKVGKTWEALMLEHVVDAMKFRRFGFGRAANVEAHHQPRGHIQAGGAYEPAELEAAYPYDAFIAPAGNMHMTIEDLARFAAEHLKGLHGKDGILKAETIKRLHTDPDMNADGSGYAAGWMLQPSEYGPRHTHAGSAGTFFAVVSIYPELDSAVAVAVNVGPVGFALRGDHGGRRASLEDGFAVGTLNSTRSEFLGVLAMGHRPLGCRESHADRTVST